MKIELQGYDKTFASDGQSSLLDSALEQGLMLPYSCRDGACGSCRGRIVSGRVDYPQGRPGALSEAEEANGEVLLCKARARSDLVLKLHLPAYEQALKIQTLPVRVSERNVLAEDVIQLFLELPAVSDFSFQAGQWLYFLLKDGRKRAFSIANAPREDRRLELHIRHVDGGVFTEFVFEKLNPGAMLRIEGPHGSFVFQPQLERPIVLLAGGTGFAPIKGIVEQIQQLPEPPAVPIKLFWGARTKADLYQCELAEQWQKQGLLKFYPVLSEAQSVWSGATGWVHEAVLEHCPELADSAVYMAGPPAMIQAAKAQFEQRGLARQFMFYDSFEYSDDARASMATGEGV